MNECRRGVTGSQSDDLAACHVTQSLGRQRRGARFGESSFLLHAPLSIPQPVVAVQRATE